jgi:hypothetical protein
MKRLIQNILKSNLGLLILFFFTFAFCLQLINTDFVSNDKIWYEYLSEQEDQKYNDEYDEYIADFEEDLKEIDLGEQDDDYGWDFFIMDSIMVLVPFLIACVGLASLIFIGFQFNEQQKHITYSVVLKSSILSYLAFFLKDIYTAIHFLVFRSNYQYEDIQKVNDQLSFALSDLMEGAAQSSLMIDILKDLNLYFLVYILLIPFFLHIATNQSYRKLLVAVALPILCGFILFESVITYISL